MDSLAKQTFRDNYRDKLQSEKPLPALSEAQATLVQLIYTAARIEFYGRKTPASTYAARLLLDHEDCPEIESHLLWIIARYREAERATNQA